MMMNLFLSFFFLSFCFVLFCCCGIFLFYFIFTSESIYVFFLSLVFLLLLLFLFLLLGGPRASSLGSLSDFPSSPAFLFYPSSQVTSTNNQPIIVYITLTHNACFYAASLFILLLPTTRASMLLPCLYYSYPQRVLLCCFPVFLSFFFSVQPGG
jgi:hypothetical protein